MGKSIVYIQDHYPNLVETFVRAEVNELIRRGYDVWVFANKRMQKNFSLCNHAEKIVAISSRKAIIERLTALNPCYIHSHFITECYKFAFPIAQQLKIPFGFTAHAYDLWHRKRRIEPEVISVISKNPLCVAAVTIGSYHKEYLEWCGVPKHKIIIIPNSINIKNLPTPREKPPKRVRNIIAVGRPVAKKGFSVAVDAMRLLNLRGYSKFNLEIVGGADDSKSIGRELLDQISGYSSIQATGLISHEETLTKIKKADLLIAPSIVTENGDSDGIPTVIPEAMLLKVPVVATNVASIPDLVIPHNTGFLARSGDPVSLANKILEADILLKHPEKANTFLARAYIRAARHSVWLGIDTLLEYLVGERRIELKTKQHTSGVASP